MASSSPSSPAVGAQEGIDETASNIIGYVSLVCWIVVMFPQIYLNYRRKSGEGVSLTMMIAWVTGDIFNITGAAMQGLVLSTILVGSYYLFVDVTLLSQTIYYRIVYKAHLPAKTIREDDEDNGEDMRGGSEDGESSAGLVGRSSEQDDAERQPDASTALIDGNASSSGPVAPTAPTPQAPAPLPWHKRDHLRSILAWTLSFVSMACLVVMIFALAVGNRRDGGSSPSQPPSTEPVPPKEPVPASQIIAQAMGTISAIVYIMSYVPQAIQNYQRKSCEGLSMWLFILSLLGNTTYALAILVVSLDPHYLAPYVPWLLGALVPCIIHIVILYQFRIYSGL
ncbi:PQ-loop-domain-containing protein [Martensiomyces pterosporus]|nr:PQ-loop-domain-containing protein [Martensiomyces pterosporus]